MVRYVFLLEMIRRMGSRIDNKSSVWYWCWRVLILYQSYLVKKFIENNIPVFCPGITDGAVGDVMYFNSYKDDSFILDVARDIRGMNDQALNARRTGNLNFFWNISASDLQPF